MVSGIQGHVAYQEQVRNPVHQVAPALADLAAERWDDGNEFFPPTSFQISNIHAGTGALNVVPGSCEIDFNLRFAPVSDAESLKSRIENILREHGLEFSIQWTLGARPFMTPPGDLSSSIMRAIGEVTGRTPDISTTGGTSDGRFISTFCPQVIEFGPTNASIHKIDEHIAVSDLEPLKDVYRRTLELLLA
jgi:succinyl-diaminopimelate desuccinylase